MVLYGILRGNSTVFELEKSEVKIGRDSLDCNVCLDFSNGISRLHADLKFEQKQVHLQDLGSQNGTFVNSQRLAAHDPILLNHGDSIVFSAYSKTSYRFEIPEESPCYVEREKSEEPVLLSPPRVLPESHGFFR